MGAGFGQQHVLFVWHATAAIAVRLLLVLLGAGEALIWQPEVTTPANTILKVKEGLRLLQLGVSPYDGASCHVPPLWLAVVARVAHHPVLYVLPNVICDIVAASSLYAAAAVLFNSVSRNGKASRDPPWLSPSQLSLLYLFNPFTVLSCVAGTLTSAENAAVMVAVAGGCLGNGPLTGFALAVGAYLGLHPVLLLVPLLLMLWRGCEDPLQAVPHGSDAIYLQHSSSSGSGPEASHSRAAAAASSAAGVQQRRTAHKQQQPGLTSQHQHQQELQQPAAITMAEAPRGWGPCLWCLGSLGACSIALWGLSELMLQEHPRSQCWRPALATLQQQIGADSTGADLHLQQLSNCWASRVYGLTLFLQDLTPNIGLWWYFFTEVFTEFQPFFLFVFHSFALALVAPLALRFPGRPLFVAWSVLFMSCMFKPYACVGDMVPWMALLPLLQQQLQSMKLRMFLVNSFVLLLVLGPAMWHQWIIVDSANANFFYSITLLLGVWYTVFLMQMLRLTCLLDRWLAGKGPPPRLTSPDGREVPSTALEAYAARLQDGVHMAQLGPEGVTAADRPTM